MHFCRLVVVVVWCLVLVAYAQASESLSLSHKACSVRALSLGYENHACLNLSRDPWFLTRMLCRRHADWSPLFEACSILIAMC